MDYLRQQFYMNNWTFINENDGQFTHMDAIQLEEVPIKIKIMQ